jgi:hypothetical protein
LTFQTRLGVVFLVSACPFLLLADGVSLSSSCSIGVTDNSVSPPLSTVISQVNPTGSCGVNSMIPSAQGQAHANVSATLYLPVPGSPATPVGGEVDADIGAFTGSLLPTITNIGMAQFSISLDLLLSTPGLIRSGLIRMNFVEGFGHGIDSPSFEAEHASIGPSLPPPTIIPSTIINVGTTPLFPFALGQDFLFHEDLAMQALSDSRTQFFESESAMPKFGWTFTLFEADGVTPVQISLATPEPRSSALTAGGFLILLSSLLMRGRRRAHWHPPA